MPFVPVDINQIKLDEKPDYSNPEVVNQTMRDLYTEDSQPSGFVPVDINKIKLDIPKPSSPPPESPNYAEDVINSIAYRGLPEGLAASNLLGYGSNVIRGVSDLTRWGAGKVYKGIYGEELPKVNENPVPTSSDILKWASKNILGKDLYEPKTTAGEFANTAAQFGSGAAAFGAPIRQAIAAGLASEGAGQLTKGTDWEIPARIAGAVVAGNYLNNRSIKSQQPLKTAQEQRDLASSLFQKAEKEQAVLTPKITDNWIDDASKSMPQTEAGKLVLGETPSSQLITRIQNLRGKKLTLKEAQEIDSGLGDLAYSHVDPKTGKLTAEGTKFIKIQDSLRKSIEKASESDIVGSKGAFSTWKQARDEWAKSYRINDIERIIQKAEGADNPTTVLKNQFRALRDNPSRFNKFDKTEKAAIRNAAKTGIIGGALKTMGGRLVAPVAGTIGGAIGGVAGGGPLGAAIGAPIGMAAGAAVAKPFRMGAEALQAKRAEDAMRAVQYRNSPPPKNPLLEILNQPVRKPLKITVYPERR